MKYIALDIGNVLCKINFNSFSESVSKYTNVSVWEVGHIFKRYQKLHDVGLLSILDILESEFKIKSQPAIDEMLHIWDTKVIQFNDTVLEYISNRRQNLKVALLSNIGIEHSEVIKKYLNNYYTFPENIQFFSCEVGVRKPNALYYKTFLDMYPEFKGCVYLDDLQENLQAGSKFGFNAMEFNLESKELSHDIHITSKLEFIYNLLEQAENR